MLIMWCSDLIGRVQNIAVEKGRPTTCVFSHPEPSDIKHLHGGCSMEDFMILIECTKTDCF